MTTRHVDLLRGPLKPDSSGNVVPVPYTVHATNDHWEPIVWEFLDTSTRDELHGIFEVPDDYVDSALLRLRWTTTATSGDVEWDFEYRAVGGNDTESLDQATAQESVNGNDAAPSATDERLDFTISLTDANFAAGDTVLFILARDGTDAGDTMSASALLFSAKFEYSDV